MADDTTPDAQKRETLDRVAQEIAEILSGVLKRHGVPSGEGNAGACVVVGWGDITCAINHGLPLEVAGEMLQDIIEGAATPETVVIPVPKVN